VTPGSECGATTIRDEPLSIRAESQDRVSRLGPKMFQHVRPAGGCLTASLCDSGVCVLGVRSLFAASFMVSGAAPAQVSNSSDGSRHELEVRSVEADPASAVRGSLGAFRENSSLSNNFGKALVFAEWRIFAAMRRCRVCRSHQTSFQAEPR
jgi:hypothetical protein